MEKHATIPVFVPHLACPNQCIFCNQKKISGAKTPPENITPFLKDAIENLGEKFSAVDIAFFGGTFTAIEEDRMISYLEQANFFQKFAADNGNKTFDPSRRDFGAYPRHSGKIRRYRNRTRLSVV